MDLSKAASAITLGTKKAFDVITDNIKANTALKQQQQLNMEQQKFYATCDMARDEIRQELISVFAEKEYPLLRKIETMGDIYPLPYEITPQGVLFKYHILRKDHSSPEYFCQQIKEHMLCDICEFHKLICGYDHISFTTALYVHPYIMSGLYIMDVKPDGAYMTITIASNYFPQY